MKTADIELSKTLQELGFTGRTEYTAVKYIATDTEYHLYGDDEILPVIFHEAIPLPRLDDIAEWLREKHGINICVFPAAGTERKVDCYAYRIDCWDDSVEEWLATVYAVELEYDEALESAINEAIEIIKKKKI